jgi:cytoskeletal protein RodZ
MARAREAAGITRAQLAAQTKIPERHLAAIEVGDFAALPAKTYAVGFSRSYARAVGLDEQEIVNLVRAEIAEQQIDSPRRASAPSFEPGDPARVSSPRLAWLSALVGLAVIVAGLTWWSGMFAPGGELPSILPEDSPSAAASEAASAPAATPSGPVVFTALEQQVWVKFSDAAGNQLFQKELVQGESYTVPADQTEVKLTTARPQALAITIGGQPVAKLAEVQQTMRDVPVTAAALLARGTAQTSPAAQPVATEPAAPGAGGPPRDTARPRARTEPRPRPVATAEASPVTPAEPQPAPAATSGEAAPANPTADR